MGCLSVVFEGGDQVGKGDATQRFADSLIKENVNVTSIAYPIYAAPIGSTIRRFLKEGIGDIKSLSKIVGTKREIEIRMMLFALNRLESLESILRHSEEYDGVFLLDRSPYSNALTIAYGLGGMKSITRDEVKDLARLGIKKENLLIQKLSLDNCVLHLSIDSEENGWKDERHDNENTDLHECKDVQEVADYVYSQFKDVVGKGWKKILTKENGKWRSREDIYKDIRKFVDTRLELPRGEGISKTVDVVDIARDIYGVDVEDKVEKYYNAITACDKSTMYKEALDIAKYVTERSTEVSFENEEVISNFRDILDTYPEILDLLEYYLGEYFVENLSACIYE